MTAPPHIAVSPVVDYEPPTMATAIIPPLTFPAASAPARQRHLSRAPAAEPPSPNREAAAAFTDAALRSVLEVIDQRRPATQLRPLLVAGLADTVVALSRAQVDEKVHHRAAAVLRRVRLQAAHPHDEAFEVAAAYSRGPRLHALACRVELALTLRGVRWQLAALHLG